MLFPMPLQSLDTRFWGKIRDKLDNKKKKHFFAALIQTSGSNLMFWIKKRWKMIKNRTNSSPLEVLQSYFLLSIIYLLFASTNSSSKSKSAKKKTHALFFFTFFVSTDHHYHYTPDYSYQQTTAKNKFKLFSIFYLFLGKHSRGNDVWCH